MDDNVNTDYIISGRRKFAIHDPKELAKYIFEDLDPEIYSRIREGDFIVSGKNFGCGSSREQAPLVLKCAGIAAVLARSFARIFYRNSMNIGLPLVECDVGPIDNGDELELELEKGRLKDLTKGIDIEINPISPIVKRLLEDGGVVEHFKKYGGFEI